MSEARERATTRESESQSQSQSEARGKELEENDCIELLEKISSYAQDRGRYYGLPMYGDHFSKMSEIINDFLSTRTERNSKLK